MRVTNKFGLPQAFVKAVENDPYDAKADYSVTGLLKPVRQSYLQMHHDDQIEEDCSERVWALFGKAVHSILEKYGDDYAEQRFTVYREGVSISGQMDVTDREFTGATIIDWKVSSVWGLIFEKGGVKPEWEQQLNLYRLLAEENGLPVRGLKVVLILRDWSKGEYDRRRLRGELGGYPESQVVTLDVPIWPLEKAEEFMMERLVAHAEPIKIMSQMALDGMDGDDSIPSIEDCIPDCTDEETWAQPAKYAVKAPKRKSAVRVFDSRIDAEDYIEKDSRPLFLEVRPGKRPRCENYCNVSLFCSQYQEWRRLNE